MTWDEKMDYLRGSLTAEDMWGQLAEEASELAQAALKMQRYVVGTNPPRKAFADLVSDIVEERGDVLICLELLRFGTVEDLLGEGGKKAYLEEKLSRWVDCIKSKQFNYANEVNRLISEMEKTVEQRDNLTKRLSHLLQSSVVRVFDEVGSNGEYIKDISSLDRIVVQVPANAKI